jgi:hypothetical protein
MSSAAAPNDLVARVKSHPVVAVAIVALSLAGSGVGLAIKLEEASKGSIRSQQKSEIATLKEESAKQVDYYKRLLASTQVVVGKDASAVDVSRIPVAADQVAQLPPDDRYVQEGDFYALRPRGGWRYSITTEPQMVSDFSGAPVAKVKAAYAKLGAGHLAQVSVFLWRNQTPYHLRVPGGVFTLYPQLAVERLPIKPLVRAAAAQVPGSGAEARAERRLLTRFFEDDPAGAMVLAALNTDIASSGPLAAASTIESVQKKGTAVYARVDSALTNAVVDGRRYPHFYYAREFVIIAAGNDVFFVKTFLPSPDPRSPDLAFVRSWFRLFHFRLGP